MIDTDKVAINSAVITAPPPPSYLSHFFIQWITLSVTLFILEYLRVIALGFPQTMSLSIVIWSMLTSSALIILILAHLIRFSFQRSWPQFFRLSWAKRSAVIFCLLLAIFAVIFATQMSVEWSTKHFRRANYRGLFAGLVATTTIGLSSITLPMIMRMTENPIHKLNLRFQAKVKRRQGVHLPNAQTMLYLIMSITFLLCWFSDALVIRIFTQLETVDLRLPHLLLMSIWSTLTLTYLLKDHQALIRLKPSTLKVMMSILGIGIIGGLSLGYFMTPEQALRIDRDTALSRLLLTQLQRFTDHDSDGQSAHWGGGDCNDLNPKIRPGIPDHRPRSDQNCNEIIGSSIKAIQHSQFIQPKQKIDSTDDSPKNFILLTIDALRYDAYRKAMPFTQAFAKRSVNFSNAYSSAAATYWSVPTLLGSRPPSYFKMGRDQTPVNTERLLTESLRDAKFHTALFANVTIFFVRGLSQGAYTKNYETSRFTVHGAKPGAAHLTQGIIKHIDRWKNKKLKPKRDRFFIWGHYYDPHDPYFEVEQFPAKDQSPAERYLSIVRSVDQELGRLFKALESRDLLKDTMIIITADHGDEFFDHGHRFHGKSLYDEMVKVPLIIYSPHYQAREVDEVIGHIDVAPTVLAHLGLGAESRFMGTSHDHSLREGKALTSDEAFFEVLPDQNYNHHMVGLRMGDEKLIYHLNRGAIEHYKLSEDPKERVNLYNADHNYQDKPVYKKLMNYVEAHLNTLAKGEARVSLPKFK
jgi:arylsulfatase A-like enzyme